MLFARGQLPYLLAGSVVAAIAMGAQLVFHTAASRLLGPEPYGLVSLAIGLATLLAVFPALGMQVAATRLISQYSVRAQWRRLKGTLAFSIALTAMVSICLAGLTLLLAGLGLTQRRTAIVFAAALIPLIAMRVLLRRSLMGLGRDRAGLFLDDGAAPLITLAALAAVTSPWYWNRLSIEIGPAWILSVFTIACGIAVLMEALLVARSLPPAVWKSRAQLRTTYWLRMSVPLLLAMLGRAVLNRLDVVAVAPAAGLEAVGHYSAAWRLAYIMMFVPLLASSLYSSRMATAYYAGNHHEVRSLFWFSCAISGLASLPMLLPFVLLDREIMSALYGTPFAPAGPTLALLAVGNMAFACTAGLSTLLAMTGREGAFATTSVAVCVVAVTVGIPVAASSGAVGAAAVFAAATVVLQAWQLAVVSGYLFGQQR